jgi:hypothetical protein
MFTAHVQVQTELSKIEYSNNLLETQWQNLIRLQGTLEAVVEGLSVNQEEQNKLRCKLHSFYACMHDLMNLYAQPSRACDRHYA